MAGKCSAGGGFLFLLNHLLRHSYPNLKGRKQALSDDVNDSLVCRAQLSPRVLPKLHTPMLACEGSQDAGLETAGSGPGQDPQPNTGKTDWTPALAPIAGPFLYRRKWGVGAWGQICQPLQGTKK